MKTASVAAALLLTIIPGVAGAETRQVTGFAPNPGDLLALEHVPAGLPGGAPLVMLLHGCTQRAAEFADASGWAALAERHRFALLLPEQQAANNRDLCFNFFLPGDNRRGRGEAASIRAMVDRALADHGLDPARVFVAGLSAGGGMAAALLAAYPETFAAGAVVAGVPYGCASVEGRPVLAAQKRWFLLTNPFGEAGWAAYACGISRLRPLRFTPLDRDPAEWAALLREAGAPAPSSWPRISLWHGADDGTAHPDNLRELVEQWTAAHGADQRPDREEAAATFRYRAYSDPAGRVAVEAFELPGTDHAFPIDPGPGPEQCGEAGDLFADRNVCAALRIAQFWGLTSTGEPGARR